MKGESVANIGGPARLKAGKYPPHKDAGTYFSQKAIWQESLLRLCVFFRALLFSDIVLLGRSRSPKCVKVLSFNG